MPYYNFEDTQKAAKFLASLDFTIFDTSQGDFTPEHVMYHCTLSYGGESFNTTYQSNPVIVSGTVGRWDGTRSGLTVYKCFEDALDTSPSRFGGDNVFADCEIQKVWDENGSLFVHGAHHDGSVTVEMRQLTDFGIEAYEVIEEVADAWVDDPFTIAGKHYDGSEQSVIEAMHDLWDNPALAQPPRYMERAFGCPVEEYVEERGIEAVNLSEMAQESREAADVLAGVTGHDDHAPDAR